jgi:hypothetical protein
LFLSEHDDLRRRFAEQHTKLADPKSPRLRPRFETRGLRLRRRFIKGPMPMWQIASANKMPGTLWRFCRRSITGGAHQKIERDSPSQPVT